MGSAAHCLRQVKPSAAPSPLIAFADPAPGGDDAAAAQVGARRAAGGFTAEGASTLGQVCTNEAKAIFAFQPLPDTLTEANAAAAAFGVDAAANVISGSNFSDTAVKAADLKKYRTILFRSPTALLPNQAQGMAGPVP